MNWLLRRVLALCSILAVMFAAILLVARLSPTPDALQVLGFDLCDGEPCFKGIKPGMNWAEARKLASDAVEIDMFLEFPIRRGSIQDVVVIRSDDHKSVKAIIIRRIPNQPLHIKAGELIAQYGLPCRISLRRSGAISQPVDIIYPTFTAGLTLGEHNEWRLELDAPLNEFSLGSNDLIGSCSSLWIELARPWLGFTSGDVYIAGNRRDSATPQP